MKEEWNPRETQVGCAGGDEAAQRWSAPARNQKEDPWSFFQYFGEHCGDDVKWWVGPTKAGDAVFTTPAVGEGIRRRV